MPDANKNKSTHILKWVEDRHSMDIHDAYALRQEEQIGASDTRVTDTCKQRLFNKQAKPNMAGAHKNCGQP